MFGKQGCTLEIILAFGRGQQVPICSRCVEECTVSGVQLNKDLWSTGGTESLNQCGRQSRGTESILPFGWCTQYSI